MGELRITRIGDELRINHADPDVMIIDEYLREAYFADDDHPYLSLRRPTEGHGSTGHNGGDYDCAAPLGGFCFHDNLITFKGANRHVIYRVDKYEWRTNAWSAHWPD